MPNINTKSQYAKTRWEDESTEIDRSISYRPKLTVKLLDDKYPREACVHQQRHMPSREIIQNETSRLVNTIYSVSEKIR